MEVRGGNGYIEEWVNARLVRDAHIGVLWEGTSNINALDIITRAVGKSRAHRTLAAALMQSCSMKRQQCRRHSATVCGRRWIARSISPSASPPSPRWKPTRGRPRAALYHITSAVLMAWEAAQPGADARRALYARLVLEHRLSAQDPLAPQASSAWERAACEGSCCRSGSVC